MPDNGFGAKNNSADALLRVYALKPDFKTATGGSGTVSPVSFNSGAVLPSFSGSSFITLRDADGKLGFPMGRRPEYNSVSQEDLLDRYRCD